MIVKSNNTKNGAWKSYVERLAFGLFVSKPRNDIVVIDLIREADQLGIDHNKLFEGFTALESRSVLKVMFGGRNATTVALSEHDEELFERLYKADDVLSALSAYQSHPRPIYAARA